MNNIGKFVKFVRCGNVMFRVVFVFNKPSHKLSQYQVMLIAQNALILSLSHHLSPSAIVFLDCIQCLHRDDLRTF